jgi:cytochrome c-type biogenesis protein CcmE
VLAKHDVRYMPREVAESLKKQGHWKDDYDRKANAPPAVATAPPAGPAVAPPVR